MVLSQCQTDALARILSAGVDRAASSLVELVGAEITVSLPSIALLAIGDVNDWIRANSQTFMPSAILRFRGPLHGTLALLFPVASANRLAMALGVEPTVDGIRETVEETGNIVLNAVAGSLANCFAYDLAFDPPHYMDGLCLGTRLGSPAGFSSPSGNFDAQVLVARTWFQLSGATIEGQIVLQLDQQATSALASRLEPVLDQAATLALLRSG